MRSEGVNPYSANYNSNLCPNNWFQLSFHHSGYIHLHTDDSKFAYKVQSALLLPKLNIDNLDDFQQLLPVTLSVTYTETPTEKVVSQIDTLWV